MKIFISFFTILFLALQVPVFALEMLSVAPRRAHPGETIRVAGGPFDGNVKVFLGDRTIQPLSIRDSEILFKLPDLPEGEYILFLRSGEENSRAFGFEIEERPPVIYSLNPPAVDECTGEEQVSLEVQGENFKRGAILLLDDAVVPSERQSAQSITLTPPSLKGGVHQVQAVNPSGRKSLPRALLVDDRPEIYSVVQGEDNVNSYDLIIHGKNFISNSELLVDGRAIRSVSGIPAQTGIVRYVDCRTLVYQRFPYSRELKPVTLRVVNPSGKQSTPFSVSIP